MMNNEFKKMMEEMVGTMMMSMMKETMMSMMSEMTGSKPEVAKAEVTTKAPKTLSREDFLALAEEKEEYIEPVELDFVVYGTKTARYNRSVASDIWTINHLAITKNYGAKWSKKNGGYVFESSSALRNFLASYQIKTTLTDDDKKAIMLYKQERARKRAEYYAGKADALLDSAHNNF